MENKTKLPVFNIVLILTTLLIFILPLSLMCLLLLLFGAYKPFELFMTLPFNYTIWKENPLDSIEIIEVENIEEELNNDK
jgi:hypothetical protein